MNNEFEVLTNIIKKRRSIYPASYLPKNIPEEVITQILNSANFAPTHKLTQPWRFVVFLEEAKSKLGLALQDTYLQTTATDKFLQKKFDSFQIKTKQAACIIAINIQFSDKIPAWEEIAATACAVQNIALTAESLNIGGYWSTPGMINGLNEFLGLAENEKCYGLFYLGYHHEEQKPANRSPMADKIKWMR